MQIFEVKTASGGKKDQNSVRKMVWGPIFQGKVEAGKIGSESPNAREGIKTIISSRDMRGLVLGQNHQISERALRRMCFSISSFVYYLSQNQQMPGRALRLSPCSQNASADILVRINKCLACPTHGVGGGH